MTHGDDVRRYIEGVTSGEIVTGRLERLAVWRHLDDLEHGAERGYYFDGRIAEKSIQFSLLCNQFEGEWAGRPLVLRPEQKFIVWNIMGWRQKSDGLRRFRQVQMEVGRKWGKSTCAAYLACLLLYMDTPVERGAQVYVAAPLDIDTPIATTAGWSTMGELKVGDVVFDEKGQPTEVVGVSDVFTGRPCYAVQFHDGSEIVADEDHRWPVSSILANRPSMAGIPMGEIRGTSQSMRRKTVIRSTADIRDTLRTNLGSANHCVEISGALQTPESELPVPPYTLGAWLGDGRSNRGMLAFHADDIEILERIEADGYSTTRMHDRQWLLRFTVTGLRTQLRLAGLLDNKHVPDVYFRSSTGQRKALLQGMMDTDGTCTATGECRFTNRNKRLADAVYDLATGLGILANISCKIVTGRPHYVVSFRAPASLPVFHLARKRERQVDITVRAKRRFITDVKQVPSRPVRCISVASESHLFLAGRSLIPTHNTKQDQAKIVWQAAQKMIERSPALAKKSKVTPSKLIIELPEYDSVFRPIASDSKTVDGFNPHCVIKDEEHAWREMHRGLADTLASGFGSRSQPITITITTYGDDESLIWQENHDYAVRCLESVISGDIIDDSWFAYIAALDYPKEQPCYRCKGESCPWCGGSGEILPDDPYDEAVWRKANPGIGSGIGFTPKIERMREAALMAQQRSDKQAEFFQKNLNIIVSARNKAVTPEAWVASRGVVAYPMPVTGHGGIDLGRSNDFAALAMVFPFHETDDEGQPFTRYELVTKFWTTRERPADLKMPMIARWIEEGHLEECSGDAVDFMDIEAQILEWHSKYSVETWAYDVKFAPQLAQRIQYEGVTPFAFGQSHKFYTAPLVEFLKIVGKSRKVNGEDVPMFKHDGNPCLAWQAGNLIIDRNTRQEMMPDKSQDVNKIDAMVAMLMALSECLYHQQQGDGYYLTNQLVMG